MGHSHSRQVLVVWGRGGPDGESPGLVVRQVQVHLVVADSGDPAGGDDLFLPGYNGGRSRGCSRQSRPHGPLTKGHDGEDDVDLRHQSH